MMRTALLALLIVIAPGQVQAQGLTDLAAPLEIQVSPSSPTPESIVTLTARNYGSITGQTTYIWTVNGRVVDQGLGRDTITVTLGRIGSLSTVSVSASEGGVDRGTASITIRPADVDIVWEADTSVPPRSSLLPLPNGGSTITFIAVPRVVGRDGVRAPTSLNYTWRVNNAQSPALSGRGASLFRITPPRLNNPFTVSVEVSTPDGSAQARGSVTIEPADPEIAIYEVAPLLGFRFDRLVNGSLGIMDEGTFKAYPFYVTRGDPGQVTWTVNERTVSGNNDDPRRITLRRATSAAAQYRIGFSYESPTRIFERARSSFTLTF